MKSSSLPVSTLHVPLISWPTESKSDRKMLASEFTDWRTAVLPGWRSQLASGCELSSYWMTCQLERSTGRPPWASAAGASARAVKGMSGLMVVGGGCLGVPSDVGGAIWGELPVPARVHG